MPSLEDLRNKWFLNFNQSTFPPVARHPGSSISDYTDGNLVTPLIDGKEYMNRWRDNILSSSNTAVYHAAWKLQDVRTAGQSYPDSAALTVLDNADETIGGKVYVLMWDFVHHYKSYFELKLKGVRHAQLDPRGPIAGSNHQKFTCVKSSSNSKVMLGSIDISERRWDTRDHLSNNPDRPEEDRPSHDVGVMIQGPAVADVERVFVERWNDGIEYHQPAYYYRYYSPNEHPSRIPLGPRLNEPSYSLNSVGSHSVQVLLTYGRTSSCQGYSWSPAGEFTIWASYLNAIQKAERYIYIEDQYFLPFGWLPPCFRRSGIAQESDIVFQLGEAIKRGVKVVVLVPAETEDISKIYQIYQRNLGCSYLNEIANNSEGEFIIASPYTPEGVPIYVHSKLMICDDELVLIGSANICQRSMTHDSELHIAIVDEEGKFARDLRRNLWSEHLGYLSSQSDLDDPDTAIEIFKEEMENPDNPKIRPYQFQQEDEPPIAYRKLMEIIDPYGGPPRFT